MDCMDEQRPDITLYFKAGVNILDEGLLWERKVENEMEKALLNHEYKVYLQPKYSVGDEKLAAAEAISLAKKLNMGIVAEGIETREQVDFLAEHDCDLIQGYYFAKPMPVEEFETKVEKDGVDFC